MAGVSSHLSNVLPLPQSAGEPSFLQVLHWLSYLPSIEHTLREQQREIAALRAELKQQPKQVPEDGWMDAKAAARYMDLSDSSFEKYRYKTDPKLPGYKMDGKTLYKRSDLFTAKSKLIAKLRERGVFILSKGAIDDYYPADLQTGDKPTRAQRFCENFLERAKIVGLCGEEVCPQTGENRPEFELIFRGIFQPN